MVEKKRKSTRRNPPSPSPPHAHNYFFELLIPYLRSNRRDRNKADLIVTTMLLSVDLVSNNWMEVIEFCDEGISAGKWKIDEALLKQVVGTSLQAQYDLLNLGAQWVNFPTRLFKLYFKNVLNHYRKDQSRFRNLACVLKYFVVNHKESARDYFTIVKKLLRSQDRGVRMDAIQCIAITGVPAKKELEFIVNGLSDKEYGFFWSSVDAIGYLLANRNTLSDSVKSFLKTRNVRRKLVSLSKTGTVVGDAAILALIDYDRLIS